MTRFHSFREFYPYYLSEHRHPVCRRLHIAGSIGALVCLAAAAASRNTWWLLGAILVGYGFAWIGHFAFERNRPATFRHPFYSLAGDWAMLADYVRGRIAR